MAPKCACRALVVIVQEAALGEENDDFAIGTHAQVNGAPDFCVGHAQLYNRWGALLLVCVCGFSFLRYSYTPKHFYFAPFFLHHRRQNLVQYWLSTTSFVEAVTSNKIVDTYFFFGRRPLLGVCLPHWPGDCNNSSSS